MPDQLQRAAVRQATLVEALSDRFAVELGEALILLRQRIRELTKDFITANGQIVKTSANLARALSLETQIREALEDAGYTELAAKATNVPLDRIAESVLGTRVGQAAAKLSAYDAEALVALKELRLAELLEVGDGLAAALWRATVDGVLGAQSRATLIEDLSDLMDDTEATAKTLYDTSVSTYMRQVDQIGTTGQPDEQFIYLGPDDNVTRPFCKKHLRKTYTRREIESMDNGQLPNPMITGGGYNCRHSWKPVGLGDITEMLREGQAA